MKKSRFTLWKMQINGQNRWGVNGLRWGTHLYTVGPHDGYWTRKEAMAALSRHRSEERFHDEECKYLSQPPSDAATGTPEGKE